MQPATDRTETRLDGVVIGVLMGFADDGAPLVVFPGNPAEGAVPARTIASLNSAAVGCEIALLFEGGDPRRPLVIGRLLHPEQAERPEPAHPPEPARPDPRPPEAPRVDIALDGERLELTAEREVVLKCGKASITLTRAGKVLIRGAHILSRATGANRIKGGSVQLN